MLGGSEEFFQGQKVKQQVAIGKWQIGDSGNNLLAKALSSCTQMN